MAKSDSTFNSRLEAVQTLIRLFKMERIVYLIITTVSLVMLIVCAGVLIVQNGAEIKILTALFGSSGLITYSLGRLLRMWDQALALLSGKGGA